MTHVAQKLEASQIRMKQDFDNHLLVTFQYGVKNAINLYPGNQRVFVSNFKSIALFVSKIWTIQVFDDQFQLVDGAT